MDHIISTGTSFTCCAGGCADCDPGVCGACGTGLGGLDTHRFHDQLVCPGCCARCKIVERLDAIPGRRQDRNLLEALAAAIEAGRIGDEILATVAVDQVRLAS